jgi:uncharacterized membrane protein
MGKRLPIVGIFEYNRHMIQKLRNKPEHVRERIALIGSVIITVAIAMVWLFANFNILEDSPSTQGSASVGDMTSGIEGPFAVVKDLFKDVGTAIRSSKGIDEGILVAP